MNRWFRLWFTFESRVTRRDYLVSGVGLVLAKYAGDMFLAWCATGIFWKPLDYVRSISLVTQNRAFSEPNALALLAIWSLPFLWIGVSMSMRRAIDAGESAWMGLLFFVPWINYLFILVMCWKPSVESVESPSEPPRPYEARLPSALMAMAAGLVIGLTMLALSVYGLGSYGAALFVGTPFVLGAVTAFLFNRRYPASRLWAASDRGGVTAVQ